MLKNTLRTTTAIAACAATAGLVAPATAQGASGYQPDGPAKTINQSSAEGAAHASGKVQYYKGGGFPQVERAEVSGSVSAQKPTGCIYAKVDFNYLTGTVSKEPQVSGASYSEGWTRMCRHGKQKMPSPISLNGLDYAKRLLTNVTVNIGTSHENDKSPHYVSSVKY